MYSKIDENLIDKICVLNKTKKEVLCIVWLKNRYDLEKFYNIIDEENILKYYLFLNAVAIKIDKQNLFKIAKFDFIIYISSVQKASVFMHNSRAFLNIDSLHKKGICGEGVCVAIIDTGCFSHLDFMLRKNRIKKFVDFINNKKTLYDDNGHGTFVAGVLAGSGLVFNGKYKGIAPDCELIILKALDHNGETKALTILNAMEWILNNKEKYNIKIVCMSFGSSPLSENDPLIESAKILWENGICVVCAGGNDGPNKSSIKSPGACPNVITVGSLDKLTDFKNVTVAPFSSRGPIFDYIKPDLLAPGVDIISTSNDLNFYKVMSGTSVSTPFVAGVCALILQKNKNITPNEIKSILIKNANFVCEDKNACGSGFLNVYNIFN